MKALLKAMIEFTRNREESIFAVFSDYDPDGLKELGFSFTGEIAYLPRKEIEILLGDIDVDKSLKETEEIRARELLEREEVLDLFNPFHDVLGRFASGSGRGGKGSKGGSSTKRRSKKERKSVSKDDLQQVSAKARKSPIGSIFRVSAKLIGLGAVGVVGYGVAKSIIDSPEPKTTIEIGSVEYIRDENGNLVPANATEAGQAAGKIQPPSAETIVEELAEILEPEWRSHNFGSMSPEEAAGRVFGELIKQGLGYKTSPLLPLRIRVVKVGSNDPGAKILEKTGSGAFYHVVTNTIVMRESVAEALSRGDPYAIHTITHELLHGRQEGFGTTAGMVAGMVFDKKDHVSLLEGQNDLMADIVLTRATNLKWTPQFDGNGYVDETKAWAAIAEANHRNSGTSRVEFIETAHDNGGSFTVHYNALKAAFPAQMAGYKSTELPSTATILGWASSLGIDPDQALINVIEEAQQSR